MMFGAATAIRARWSAQLLSALSLHRQRILELMSKRQDEALAGKSMEELQATLTQLGASEPDDDTL